MAGAQVYCPMEHPTLNLDLTAPLLLIYPYGVTVSETSEFGPDLQHFPSDRPTIVVAAAIRGCSK